MLHGQELVIASDLDLPPGVGLGKDRQRWSLFQLSNSNSSRRPSLLLSPNAIIISISSSSHRRSSISSGQDPTSFNLRRPRSHCLCHCPRRFQLQTPTPSISSIPANLLLLLALLPISPLLPSRHRRIDLRCPARRCSCHPTDCARFPLSERIPIPYLHSRHHHHPLQQQTNQILKRPSSPSLQHSTTPCPTARFCSERWRSSFTGAKGSLGN